jgi:hypothetical protein
MKQNNKNKLKGNVDADETPIGGYTNKNKDRSLESKQAILLATEKLPDGRTGNIRMQPIENFGALTLKLLSKIWLVRRRQLQLTITDRINI